MARIPFKIEYRPQIESGEYKVVTDCGEPVEIVKWNCKGECPILAVIDDGDVEDTCFFNEAGISPHGTDSLYVITDEPELTEFEIEIKMAIEDWAFNNAEGFTESDSARKHAIRILNAARDIILKDMPKWHKNIAEWDSTTEHLYKGYYIDLEEVFDKLTKEE